MDPSTWKIILTFLVGIFGLLVKYKLDNTQKNKEAIDEFEKQFSSIEYYWYLIKIPTPDIGENLPKDGWKVLAEKISSLDPIVGKIRRYGNCNSIRIAEELHDMIKSTSKNVWQSLASKNEKAGAIYFARQIEIDVGKINSKFKELSDSSRL